MSAVLFIGMNGFAQTRTEKDLLGEKEIPADAYYGVQTARALVVRVAGDESTAHKKARCDDYKLQVEMKKLGFSQQIAPCLPAGDPIKPQGCQ